MLHQSMDMVSAHTCCLSVYILLTYNTAMLYFESIFSYHI